MTTANEFTYLNLLRKILIIGEDRTDRTGVGVRSSFGHRMEFNLTEGFPLLTTKKVFFRGVVEELLWMLRGETNVRPLQQKGVHIWDEWADKNGDLGPVYGAQWRNWHGTDQIARLCDGLKNNHRSRRHLVSAWNEDEIQNMNLPPCHFAFQCYVSEDKKLSLQVYQRSADLFLGVPFNIASYALLAHILANHCGYGLGRLIWTGGDCHIYHNHSNQVREQLSREPKNPPSLKLKTGREFPWEHKFEDFVLVGYDPHPAIKANVAV